MLKTAGRLLVLLSLATSLDAQGAPIEVTEVTTTIGRSDSPFSTISDIVAASPTRILVTDYETPAIWAWNPESGAVARVARGGDGPGEVETPMVLARRPGGGFAVYDNGHSAIILYSEDFEYEEMARIGLVSNPKDLLLLADGSFVVAGGKISDTHHLQRYGPDGEMLEVWGTPEPGVTHPMAKVNLAGGSLRALADGGWLFAQTAPYRVARFAPEAFTSPVTLFEDTELVPNPTDEALVSIEDNRISFRWWFDHISGLVRLDGDRTLTVVTRYYSGDSVWTIHDASGDVVGRTVIDRAYKLHDQLDASTFVGSYRDPVTDERIAVVLDVAIAGGALGG